MVKRVILPFIAGAVVGAIVSVIVLFGGQLYLATRPVAVKPPLVAGQYAPEKFFTVDFDQHYDLVCVFGGHGAQSTKVYENCKILGFTSRAEFAQQGIKGHADFFDKWLVLERTDGRLIFIEPRTVHALESSAVQK